MERVPHEKRYLLLCLLACCDTAGPGGLREDPGDTTAKPVLYLYPEEETTVYVQLDYTGQLSTTYPALRGRLDRHPPTDGTLTDPATGRNYYCLWEGLPRWRMISRKALWSPARTPPPS